MLKKILFLLLYLFMWVVFFELTRIYFLFSTRAFSQQVPDTLLIKSLWYGLKMDLSMAGYITAVVCLFVFAGLFIPGFRNRKIYLYFTAVLLFLQLLLVVVDAELYKAWGTRIDFTPLKYLASPKEVWASVSHLPVALILVGLLVVFAFCIWLLKQFFIRTHVLLGYKKYSFVQGVLILLFTTALIVPIRGGFQLSPLNQSSVYFSNNQYANNAAVNATWNFMFSLTHMNQLSKNPYVYMPAKTAADLTDSLFFSLGKTDQVIRHTDSSKPNVLFIIWESFTEKALHFRINGLPVIKFFPELMREGIYFSRCYSSGDRTDKGISAVLSSYPALPKGSVVNFPQKAALLSGLGPVFLNRGYSTHFFYGGEPEFANIKSYLVGQQFQNLVTKNDFEKSEMNSKWGAHDEVVMRKMLHRLSIMKEPFFATWLTLSSHEPFETPVPPVFHEKDKQTRFFNSLHYTDSVVYSFIQAIKQSPLWANTIIIISADHGHYLPITGKRADDYKIPVLWLGGALLKQNMVIKKTVSQLDMAGSLVEQLQFGKNPFRFSKNVFDSSAGHWAFFTYNDGIGFVTDSSRLLFDNTGKKVVFEEGKTNSTQAELAKALMQVVYDDFLKK